MKERRASPLCSKASEIDASRCGRRRRRLRRAAGRARCACGRAEPAEAAVRLARLGDDRPASAPAYRRARSPTRQAARRRPRRRRRAGTPHHALLQVRRPPTACRSSSKATSPRRRRARAARCTGSSLRPPRTPTRSWCSCSTCRRICASRLPSFAALAPMRVAGTLHLGERSPRPSTSPPTAACRATGASSPRQCSTAASATGAAAPADITATIDSPDVAALVESLGSRTERVRDAAIAPRRANYSSRRSACRPTA